MAKYSNTSEDAMVNRLIEHHRGNVTPKGELGSDKIPVLQPEAHYNYYGDRGVVDLYVVEKFSDEGRYDWTQGTLYEVKSNSALDNVSGANEIVRQFNRMQKYFYEDESWRRPKIIHYELCFIPSPETLEHVSNNQEIYRQLIHDTEKSKASVMFRTPDGSIDPANPMIEFVETVPQSVLHSQPGFAPYFGFDEEEAREIIESADVGEERIGYMLDRLPDAYTTNQ